VMRTFLGGLGIGTLIGMAIAPAAGRQTRQALKSRVKQLRQQAGFAGKRAGTRVRRIRQGAYRFSPGYREPSFPPRRTPLSFINNAAREDLMAVPGIGEVLADKIMRGRPYKSESAVRQDQNLPSSILDLVKADFSKQRAS